MWKFFKILIGLSPICCVCIYVGPLRHSNHVLRQFSSYSCIIHRCCVLLHVRCLTECPSDILVLNWTQVSHFGWVYFWLTMFNMFWSLNVCSTHFAQVVPQCHVMHTLGTHYASPVTLTCISSCTTHSHTCTVMHYAFVSCFNTYSMLVLACLLCFELVVLGFKLFYFSLELTWI